MTPAADVIIVSYNTRLDLEACLRSLAGLQPGEIARIVVVDNGSTDGSVEAVRKHWPEVELVPLGHNAGFGAANNIGFARCTSPLVLLLNPDTVVAAGAVATVAGRLRASGAVAAGPRLVDREGRPEVSFGPMLSPFGEARQWWRQRRSRSTSPRAIRATRRLLSRERFVDWVTAACCLVDRQAAAEVGLFDERYFLYEEDVDFCAALRARGGRILFTPAAEVVHARGRAAVGARTSARRHYDRSHLLFYEKHCPRWAPALRLWQRLRRRSIR
jgi:GT2 family glycosyltransferase